MSDTTAAPAARRRNLMIGLGLGAAIAAFSVVASGGVDSVGRIAASARPHAPDLALLAAQPPAIQLHLVSVAIAFVVGAVLLLGPKGTLPHRTLGWTWAIAMGTVAVSSLFIREINEGGFSFVHAISGWVIVALPAALYAARRHKVAAHRGAMTGMYFGGMFLAGGLAFLPGRLMWRLFFG
ncbi:DUF2306 domain-containing protein [Phenylobacterium sp.]|jgi:uncharacterized membrane protein|uniref:DUF2306 domain-containing protein n=1 Tax=Phenylobacterium sp. TaxID=1871053 RepID=UPI002F94B6A7